MIISYSWTLHCWAFDLPSQWPPVSLRSSRLASQERSYKKRIVTLSLSLLYIISVSVCVSVSLSSSLTLTHTNSLSLFFIFFLSFHISNGSMCFNSGLPIATDGQHHKLAGDPAAAQSRVRSTQAQGRPTSHHTAAGK